MTQPSATPGIEISGEITREFATILTPEAIDFLAGLARRFTARRNELLAAREVRQQAIDRGELPDFLPETAHIRADTSWRIAPVPADLQDRRVEITGPTDRKMVINALNSGAKVFMADCEDANAPTWRNMLNGQINLRDAVSRSITFTNPDGRFYQLNDQTATLMVRPRGWHLDERHFCVDGAPVPAGLFDFGLYFFHNARAALDSGTGPYVYLPKLESHLEARLWNDVFVFAQDSLGIPRGSIKATVLIETILAVFEAEEIIYELRQHSAGLNCGRWDYIFSYIKKLRAHSDFLLPDRAQVSMTVPFMRQYTLHVIKVCHRRGAHAMGGMAAQIPIRKDPAANQAALDKVRADKIREAQDGHDGTWVAHPGLVPVAREVFDEFMPSANQVDKQRDDVSVTASDLLTPCGGDITEAGLRLNIKVGIQYLEAWLGGNGCVPLYGLMEDAATAEISRAQLWQWLHHKAALVDDRPLTAALYSSLLEEEMAAIRAEVGDARFENGHFPLAMRLFDQMIRDDEFREFLTLPAYGYL
ncbi:MAG: malate synthase A [Chloroflexi bacterium]|nr:malate synthase A [Chloroflexota bacterium]MCY4247360.1 malate synthase A [Chloroflexota bacterium]